MELKKTGGFYRDEDGKFISKTVAEQILLKQEELAKLEKAATNMVAAEQEPPEWLKQVVVAIADSFGITAKEFDSRVRVIHPTPIDPVILVDGTPVLSWL